MSTIYCFIEALPETLQKIFAKITLRTETSVTIRSSKGLEVFHSVIRNYCDGSWPKR